MQKKKKGRKARKQEKKNEREKRNQEMASRGECYFAIFQT